MGEAPVFILGVPRSGTTLLRTILDSHSRIACGPETPWLGGHQPRSVMELWRFLREHPQGYCASYGMGPDVVTEAAREFVGSLMDAYARRKGKARWAEKTPDNILHLDFLLTLFPEARVVWLTRDGLDVAVSTSVIPEARRGISPALEKHLSFGPGVPLVPNNPLTAVLRWNHWNRLIGRGLTGREYLKVAYERLVSEPAETVRQVAEFIGERFEPGMLDYGAAAHEYPPWEWGSADVRSRSAIGRDRVGRGRRELPAAQLAVLEPIARGGRGAGAPGPGEWGEEPLRQVIAWLDAFVSSLGLSAPGSGCGVDAAWLWLDGVSRRGWEGKRVVQVGGARGVLAWGAALLGADVTVIGQPDEAMRRLRDGLRVRLEWREPAGARLPADDAWADAVVGVRLAKGDDPAEVRRILRPGGLLAASWAAPGNADAPAIQRAVDAAFSAGPTHVREGVFAALRTR
jgi:protein-tyrosine sulfotransferase